MSDLAEIDVDQIVADTEKPEAPREMGGETTAAPVEAQAPTWNGTEWEFEWNGKKVAPDSRDKAMTWMSQGYNYSQRMGELNAKERAWKAERESLIPFKEKYSRYNQVDEYASKNPDWWKHVEESYANRQNHGVDPNLSKVLSPIQEKLASFEQFIGSVQEREQQQQINQENQALETDIESTRKQHPNIDFDAVDPASGETLERRVLLHANKIETGSFRVAFRDYLHDKLLEDAKANGRQAIAKDKEIQAKKGVLGETPAPRKMPEFSSVKGKSWNQIQKETLEELRQQGII